MDLAVLQTQRRLLVRQKITMLVNRYVVHVEEPDGSEGEVVAFAEQKPMTFRQQVTLYTDESCDRVLATFRARRVREPGIGYDVVDENDRPIGYFRKGVGSWLRPTWHFQQPGLPTFTGRERNVVVSLLRRFGVFFGWLPFHFDFSVGAHIGFTVERRRGLLDRYRVRIDDHRLDRRLVIAAAVALDATQSPR
jgi:hypothetical protein